MKPLNYGPFKGYDASFGELNLPRQYAAFIRNLINQKGQQGYESRRGFQTAAPSTGYMRGIYKNINPTTGAITEEIVFTKGDPHVFYKLVPKTIAITLSGAALSYLFSFYATTTTNSYTFQILSGSTALYTLNTTITSTVQNLVDGINAAALTGVTAALGTAAGTELLNNFLPVMSNKALLSGSVLTLTGEAEEVINFPDANYNFLSTSFLTDRATASAEPMSSTNIQSCLYIANGYDELLKYDGQRVYKASMPPGSYSRNDPLAVTVTGTAGALGVGYYTYAMAFEHKDKKGNVIEGLLWAEPNVPGAGGYPGPVQVSNAGSLKNQITIESDAYIPINRGYNTSGGRKITGAFTFSAGSTHTITNIDDGAAGAHTLKVGDPACFRATYNTGGGAAEDIFLIEGTVSAVTSSSVTILDAVTVTYGLLDPTPTSVTGASVPRFFEEETTISALIAHFGASTITCELGQPISAGLRINLYRNQAFAAERTDYEFDWYLNDIVPHYSGAGAIVLTDNFTDAELGPIAAQKIPVSINRWPASFNTPCPAGRYVNAHKNRLYLAGPANPNTLFRSDLIWGPEWFDPEGSAEVDVSSSSADTIVGISGLLDSYIIAKSRSVVQITGDLASDTQIRTETIGEGVECVSHASLQLCYENLVLVTKQGPLIIGPNGQVEFLGPSEVPKSNQSRLINDMRLKSIDWKRVESGFNETEGLYMFGIKRVKNPELGYSASNDTVLGLTRGTNDVFVYDFNNNNWHIWKIGNDATWRGCMIMKEGRMHAFTPSSMLRENQSFSIRDYSDDERAVSVTYTLPIEYLGDPSAYKQFIKLRIQARENPLDQDNNFTWSVAATYFTQGVSAISDSFSLAFNFIAGLTRSIVVEKKFRTFRALGCTLNFTSGTIHKKAVISGIEMEVATPFSSSKLPPKST